MTEEAIFAGALERTTAERAAYLDAMCGGDVALRRRVEALLVSDEDAGSFLHEPAALAAAETAADLTPAGDDPSEGTGSTIGPYRLIEKIGEGAMGVVYMAQQDQPIRRTVAVKIIKPGMDSRQIIARFQAERQTLALMNHPNIAAVLDAGMTSNLRPYFVMELVKGVPITKYCDDRRLTPRERLELFIPVCEAIQHAHQKGIIHRDIKPSNVLVAEYDDRAVPKVIDFGVAKAIGEPLGGDVQHTAFGAIVGTLQYMAPEQAKFNALDVDTRTDVYALGAVLYELLSGSPPLKEELTEEAGLDKLLAAVRDAEPPRPSTRLSSLGAAGVKVAFDRSGRIDALASQLRSELEWIPLKAMRKERDRRYASPLELAEDIGNYLQDRPLRAGPESAAYRLRKALRRNRAAVITAAAFVLLAAAAVGFYIHTIRAAEISLTAQRDEADRQRRDAEAMRAEATRQADAARVQAGIANAVKRFQSDMLTAADPLRGIGDKVTVLQVIQEAVQKLNAGPLKDQPLVEADVQDTIGKTLMELGRLDDAEPMLRRALATRRKVLPPADPAIAASINDVALLLQAQGKRTEAEAMFRESLSLMRAEFPANHPQVAFELNNLAALLEDEKRMAEAEPLLREALAIRRQASPPDPSQTATCLSNLAAAMGAQNRPVEAEQMFHEALDLFRAVLPPGHPKMAVPLNNLAFLKQRQGKFSEAEPLFLEELDIYRHALPAMHPLLAMGLNNLGTNFAQENKLAEAEKAYREALEIHRHTLPAGHPRIALSLNNLGKLLQRQGKQAEAEPLYREALQIYRQVRPPEPGDIAMALNDLGVLLQEEGKLSEADPLCLEALEIRRKVLPAGHFDIAASLNNMGTLRARQGKPADAEPFVREALAMNQSRLPAGHPTLITMVMNLGTLLDTEQKPAEAEKLYRDQLAGWRDVLPADHVALAHLLVALGGHRLHDGKFSDAEALFREAAGIFRKKLPPESPVTANAIAGLARALVGMGRLADAEPVLREALEIRRKSFGLQAVPTRMTAGALADLLDRTQRQEDAAQVRKEYGLIAASTQPALPHP